MNKIDKINGKFPILNQPQYLSPSSISEYFTCGFKFYLKRLAGLPYPTFFQSPAAACGCAFDAFIKVELARRLGLGNDPRFSMDALLESVEEQNKSVALTMGKQLFDAYEAYGCIDNLMAEGLATIDLPSKMELVNGEDSIVLHGIPDAALDDGTIIDFKVQGAMSKSGASPTPGYERSISEGIPKFKHARCGEYLENLNESWARQLTIYSWLHSGINLGKPIRVGIENITVRSAKVTCSSIRTLVSAEYQKACWDQIVDVWSRVTTGNIPDPRPNNKDCYAWGTLCEVSEHCSFFKEWQRKLNSTDELDMLKR